MASSTLIGSLRVALGLDSASFVAGTQKAEGALSGLAGSLKAFAAGAAGALTFGAVTAVIKSSIDHMDELNKASQKIGIPVDQLSALQHAADLADLSMEGLQTSMKKLSTGLAAVAGGGKSDAGDALKAMGISALDAQGKIRPLVDITADVADKFKSYKDGAEKSALAVALFSRGGLEMIPLLNGGSAALKQASDEARVFGIVVTKEASQAAEDFNDNLTRVRDVGQGWVTQITSAILPALNNLVIEFLNTALKAGELKIIGEGVNKMLTSMAAFAVQTAHEFRALSTIFGVMQENWQKSDGFTAATARWGAAFDEIQKDSEETTARINKMFNMSMDPTGTLASIDQFVAGMNAANQTGQQAAPVIQTVTKGLTDAQKAAAKLKEEGQQLWESTRTPIEQYQLGIRHLNELMQAGVIDQDTYARGVQQLQDQFKDTGQEAESMAQKVGGELSGAFQSFITSAVSGTFDLSNSLKDLLGNLTQLALNSVFQSLFSGGGGGLYGGGGGIGGIFGKLFGFAKGGTIMPGGHGGIDSQLVMFRKSPNERVDISKPGQTMTSGRGGGFTLIDQRSNAPKVEVQQDGQGNYTAVIRDEVNRTISGGYSDPSMGGRYGIRPAKKRR